MPADTAGSLAAGPAVVDTAAAAAYKAADPLVVVDIAAAAVAAGRDDVGRAWASAAIPLPGTSRHRCTQLRSPTSCKSRESSRAVVAVWRVIDSAVVVAAGWACAAGFAGVVDTAAVVVMDPGFAAGAVVDAGDADVALADAAADAADGALVAGPTGGARDSVVVAAASAASKSDAVADAGAVAGVYGADGADADDAAAVDDWRR